jgi:DNA repair protein RecN (Recombination protein N)
MLSRIAIRNLVIVAELELEFAPGMTALTGETGAGKSILVDALGLALGDKADSGLIRQGAERAEVAVTFEPAPGSPALAWLADHDLADEETCILRRVLVRDGRSRASINGSPVPVSLLRELGTLLVDIHGQNAHQALLSPAAQRGLLDGYAGLERELAAVAATYRAWREAESELDALRAAASERAARLDYLAFQVGELEAVACSPDALQGLESEHARLANAGRLLQDCGQLLASLGEEDPSAQQVVDHAVHALSDLSRVDPDLCEVRELLEGVGIQLGEAVRGLRRYLDRVEPDPDRLEEIDRQLGRLHDAARKHRVAPAELGELLERLREEMAGLENADARGEAIAREAQAQQRAYLELARALGAGRLQAAGRLGATVTASMQTLGMAGGQFAVQCEALPDKAGPNGFDRVQFLVTANPGQPPAPLNSVASGGELSRIGLAIQVATADCGQVPTLIFDEVDVGIGGAVAEIVGQLLRRLGRTRQVLCVTHLPQVAAQAHRQLGVRKSSDGRSTETRIEALGDDERVGEIARMLGGVTITEQTRLHAREMIERVHED